MSKQSIVIWILTIIAIAFGALTIKSGGQVLFGDPAYREAAGHYVLFVLWFNFIAGFMYIIAGTGIRLQQRWAVWLSLVIAITTLLTFAGFGFHIFQGGEYETRTVAAMSIRSVVWISIFLVSFKILPK
ncbi:MAG: hypothetical protein KAH77_07305 [Thiomargarita sp.]|nr:hypothetical protein [Thiomargarita sp.]